MAAFLSPAWIAELDAAARAAAPSAGSVALRVAVEVPDAPGGAVRYVMVLDPAGARVLDGSGDPGGEDLAADVTLCQTYAVARRIHAGSANAQQVLAERAATVDGDLNRLVAAAADLVRLEDAFAAVRASTTFAE